jgi:hypothetical protein
MSHEGSMPDLGIGPTDAEIEAWSAREHRRREQWTHGPTPEQTALWALRERERRTLAQHQLAPAPGGSLARGWPLRELQLAAMGALGLAVNTSIRDAIEYLVQTGLAWEEEMSLRRGPMSR